ncbi:MAG: hypothetical protein WC975_06490 [Phycisphaerae bacterium]
MIYRILFFVGITLAVASAAETKFPADLDISKARAIPVQHDGRLMPLDTLARDMVYSVTGDEYFQGRDPVRVLLDWTFDPMMWKNEPLITIRNSRLRQLLELSSTQTVYSFDKLVNHEPLIKLFQQVSQDPLETQVGEIHKKLDLLNRIFTGQVIKPITDPKKISTEIHYNSLRPFRLAWMVMIVGAVLYVYLSNHIQKGEHKVRPYSERLK